MKEKITGILVLALFLFGSIMLLGCVEEPVPEETGMPIGGETSHETGTGYETGIPIEGETDYETGTGYETGIPIE